ncbi:MAG: hypothetical protein D6744_16820, partial [Planctomycetota bacterium]
PFLLSAGVLSAGALVLPLDLELAHKTNAGYFIIGYAGLLYVAAMLYFGGRFVRRRVGGVRFDRATYSLSAAALLLSVVTIACLFATPVGRPGAGRRVSDEAATATSAARGPHVLWIVLDTVRADRLSVYGYERETTPFLKQWSQQALVFERAIANGMWTVPTHASMFTGMPSRRHGQGHRAVWLDDEFDTVAEKLQRAGYATAFFSNNPLVSERYNVTQGFDHSIVVWHAQQATRFSLDHLRARLGTIPPVPWLDPDSGAALTNDFVEDWLGDHSGEPTLVFINLFEAHLPYRVPQRYRRMFMTPEQVRESYKLQYASYGDMADWVNNRANIDGYAFLSDLEVETIKRMYDASLRCLDDRLRELLAVYRRLGILDNTLVVITADHGEYLDSHGMWSHHFLTYEELTHVPLIVRPPGTTVGARVPVPVQLSDLYATIVRAALGADAFEPTPDSRDLLAPNGADSARIAVIECYGPEPSARVRLQRKTDPVVRHRATAQIAAVAQRYKYIRSEDGWRELFDLAADPGEETNIISSHRAVANRLDAFLNDWLRRVPEYVPKHRPEARSDALETLKALGYVAGDETGD